MPPARAWSAIVLSLSAVARPAAAQSTGAASLPAAIDSVFAPWNRTDGPGCTVGVEHEGRRVTRAYGMADLEDRIALTPESVIETGSVAKQFTSAVLLLLERQGKLSLDDDIRKHLPEVPDFGKPITIRHLLHHTSGLRDQWGLLAIQGFPPGREVHTFGRILDLVSRQRRLNFPPGEEYLYSNTGYALSAVIATRAGGKPFAELSRELLFEPLGMHATQWRDDYRRVVPGRGIAYRREGGAWVQDMPFTMVHGNGGLLTTVGDLLAWNAALTAGTIPGGPEVVRALETRGRLNDGSEIGYALGLGVGTYRGMRQVSHGGATAGYRTFLTRLPERSLSIAVLCNAASANPQGDAQRVVDRVLGLSGDPAPPSPAVAIAPDELAPLAGRYRDSTSDQMLTVTARDGGLFISGGGPQARLTHLGDFKFWGRGPGELRFERAASGWRIVQFADAWRRYDPMATPDSTAVKNADYLGRYRSPELEVVLEVFEENGRLMLRRRPDPAIRLNPFYRDGFAGPGQSFRFDRGKNGRVVGLRAFAGRVRGLEFERLP
jgi:CubicO group peptidase (beta-lactamase class C family)